LLFCMSAHNFPKELHEIFMEGDWLVAQCR